MYIVTTLSYIPRNLLSWPNPLSLLSPVFMHCFLSVRKKNLLINSLDIYISNDLVSKVVPAYCGKFGSASYSQRILLKALRGHFIDLLVCFSADSKTIAPIKN